MGRENGVGSCRNLNDIKRQENKEDIENKARAMSRNQSERWVNNMHGYKDTENVNKPQKKNFFDKKAEKDTKNSEGKPDKNMNSIKKYNILTEYSSTATTHVANEKKIDTKKNGLGYADDDDWSKASYKDFLFKKKNNLLNESPDISHKERHSTGISYQNDDDMDDEDFISDPSQCDSSDMFIGDLVSLFQQGFQRVGALQDESDRVKFECTVLDDQIQSMKEGICRQKIVNIITNEQNKAWQLMPKLDCNDDLKPVFCDLEQSLLKNSNVKFNDFGVHVNRPVVNNLSAIQSIAGYDIVFNGKKNHSKLSKVSDKVDNKQADLDNCEEKQKVTQKKVMHKRSLSFENFTKALYDKQMIEKDSYRKHKDICAFQENGAFFTLKLKQKNDIKLLLKYAEGISVQTDKTRQSKIVKDYQSLCDLKTEIEHIYKLWKDCKKQGKIQKIIPEKVNREYKMLRQKNRLLHEKLKEKMEQDKKISGNNDIRFKHRGTVEVEQGQLA